jgi:hypothetical protein
MRSIVVSKLAELSYHYPDRIAAYLTDANLDLLLEVGFRFSSRVIAVLAKKTEHLRLAFMRKMTRSLLSTPIQDWIVLEDEMVGLRKLPEHSLWDERNEMTSEYYLLMIADDKYSDELSGILKRTGLKVDITSILDASKKTVGDFRREIFPYIKYMAVYPNQIVIDQKFTTGKICQPVIRCITHCIARLVGHYPQILTQFSWMYDRMIPVLLDEIKFCPNGTVEQRSDVVQTVSSAERWNLIINLFKLVDQLPKLTELENKLRNKCDHCLQALRTEYQMRRKV